MLPYPCPTSSGSLQYSSSLGLTNDSANSFFMASYDKPIWVQPEDLLGNTTPPGSFDYAPAGSPNAQTQYSDEDPPWMIPEELEGELKPPTSMQLPLDVSPTVQPMYNSVSNTHSGSNDSINSMIFPNCHADLSRITEHETWNLTGLDNDMKNRDLTHQLSPSLTQQQQISYPVAFSARASRRSSFDAPSNQQSRKPNGRSRPSSSFETQTPPKRRRSHSGAPETVPSPNDSSPDAEINVVVQEALTKPTSKPSVRGSHSVIERRYRENLNTKMTQLDQTLTAIHDRSRKANDLEMMPRHLETSGKTRKADVLDDAMRYVKQAELEGESKTKEIDFLRLRVEALEKLVHCGDCALLKQFAGQKIGGDTTNF